MGLLCVIATIILTAYGQVILKWRIVEYGALPVGLWAKLIFLIKLLFDPYIFSSFLSAFIASLFWMAAMTKLDVSYAYPLTSGTYLLVLIASLLLLKEPFSFYKVTGLCFIILGLIISSKSV